MSEKEPQEESRLLKYSQQPPPRPSPTMDKDTTPSGQPVNENQEPTNSKPQMIKFSASEGQDEVPVFVRLLVQRDQSSGEDKEHSSDS